MNNITSTDWKKIINDNRADLKGAMEHANLRACESPAMDFCVGITPAGDVFEWDRADNKTDPESVQSKTALQVYSVSRPQNWDRDSITGKQRDALSGYLREGESIPDDISDAEIYGYLDKNYPHCIKEYRDNTTANTVCASTRGYDGILDGLINRLSF